VASTLVDVAEEQSECAGKLLDQLKMALEEFDRRTIQLTRDMPNEIAQQAAQKVVQSIADLVTQKVADVLRPVEAEAQRLLREMKTAAAEYRRAAWRVVLVACLSGSASAVLVLALAKTIV
jgi:uncharacterized protein YaaW (UPF0174 family)